MSNVEKSNVHELNPYAPPSTTDAASGVGKSTSIKLYPLFIVQTVLIVVAWGMIFIDIETILATGPLLIGIGVLNTWLAYRRGNFVVARFAISSPLFAVFIVVLIAFFRWGPMEATKPIRFLSNNYAGVAVIWAMAIHYFRAAHKP